MTKIDNFYELVVKEQVFSIFSTDSVSDFESFVTFWNSIWPEFAEVFCSIELAIIEIKQFSIQQLKLNWHS